MESACMEPAERQADFESQAGQGDMLQALRSACLPDDFWMYSYKILPCPHGYRHSWTHCPFSHTGETARRRCPRMHVYAPDPCIHARSKRPCPHGDACPYAHNTFEQWLHPARYRTRLCYLGSNCRRPTCFFAHSVEELRSVEESENNASTTFPPATSPSASLLQHLPLPPPLPAPSSANTAAAPTAPSGESVSAPLPVLQPMATPAAPALSPQLGTVAMTQLGGAVLQPVAFLCMQQPPLPQSGANCQMQPPGAFIAYSGRPALPRRLPPQCSLPTSLSEPSNGGQQMAPQLPPPTMSAPHGMIPMAMQLHSHHIPRSHMGAAQAVAVAALHPAGGAVHIGPGGTMYVNGCMTTVRQGTPMLPMHAPPPPPPHGFPATTAPTGYMTIQRGVEGMPSGRSRSYSNPGDVLPQPPTASAAAAMASGMRVSGGGESYGASANRTQAPLNFVAPQPLPSPHSPAEYKARPAYPAARHMPAPTNRGVAARRVSNPPLSSAQVDSPPSAAAAPVAAAATARRYADLDAPAAVGGMLSSLSDFLPHGSPVMSSLAAQSANLDEALRALQLVNPVAAPPPTPSASSLTANSPYSLSAHSSPLLDTAPGAAAAQHMGWLPPNASTAPGSSRDIALVLLRSPSSSSDGSATFSRDLSAGSAASGASQRSASRLTAFDAHAANAAAVLAAASAAAPSTPPGPPLSMSASASGVFTAAAAAAAMMGMPCGAALLQQGSDAGDLYGIDDVAEHVRSSDPGPGHVAFRTAMRRISSEFGSTDVGRNSDPGQSVSGASSLLLPLLQSVLAEGLASGQFELVNGQLQVKGVSGCGKGAGSGVAGVEATQGGWGDQDACSEASEMSP